MKKDLRIIKTKDSLRKALLSLLREKELKEISVTELCRRATINRGTFYLHYKDVHGIMEEYWNHIMTDLKESYDEPYYQTNFQIENVEAEMVKIFHHVKAHQDFYQIIFDKKTPMMYYYLLFDIVHALVSDSFSRSELPDDHDIEKTYLISYQTNAILGLLLEWHQQDYQTPVEVLNQQLIYSVRWRKGMKATNDGES